MHASSHIEKVVIQGYAYLSERYKSVAVLIQMSRNLSQLQFSFAAIAVPRTNMAETEFKTTFTALKPCKVGWALMHGTRLVT